METVNTKTAFLTDKKICSSVRIAYQTSRGSWRGFVRPFNLTVELSSKGEVKEALDEMCALYQTMLDEYGNPEHLVNKPFTNAEDRLIFERVSVRLIGQKDPIEEETLYAEAV